ncbi:MAG: LCP family protein [Patescibacteria group bacterium]|nr:LCP family protein [Patescibacteria group bacterium]
MSFQKRKINLLEPEGAYFERPDKTPVKEAGPSGDGSEPRSKANSRKRRGSRKISFFFILLIIIFSLGAKIISAGNDSFLSGVKNSYLLRQISNIISPKEKWLKGEKDDRINFVLLGMGGEGHDGPYLTDTIIIASFKPSSKEAAIFSLPRDMIVPINREYRKINSIYSIGLTGRNKNGGELVKEILSQTFDLPIHYYVAADFKGFMEMIDAIGGVEVEVERSFVDNQFPAANYQYQRIAFQAGWQEMDGLTALRFARSRYGNNNEGSDFARIKRQQKIIIAAKEKVTSFDTLINPKKISQLYSIFNQYTQTDLELWEAVKLFNLGKEINSQKIITQSIDDRAGGYLRSGIALSGAYILQPIGGSYDQISFLLQNVFEISPQNNEEANIVIQNGTLLPGLALKAVNHLNQIGYRVIRYGNAEFQNQEKTLIYNYNEDNPQTKRSLEAIFKSKANDNPPLEHLAQAVAERWHMRDANNQLEKIDFLIILGKDQIIDETLELLETIPPELLAPTSTEETSDEEDQIEENPN